MQPKTINIPKFISLCTQIVSYAGKTIKEVHESGDLGKQLKGEDDPFTIADVKVQTLVIKSLRNVWPDIKIIGEEGIAYEGDLGVDPTKFTTDKVSADLFKDAPYQDVDLNDSIVWIDPLDGTQGFVEGKLDGVTTLIGIATKGKASVGVVGKYFTKNADQADKYDYTPRCFFGMSDYNKSYVMDYLKNDEIKELKAIYPENKDRLIFCVTYHHMTQDLQEKINKCKPDGQVNTGGSGGKVLYVIEGMADCYFYPKNGCKRWDICPLDAILNSLGGSLVNKYGKPYTYPDNKDDAACVDGVIAVTRKPILDRVIKSLNE